MDVERVQDRSNCHEERTLSKIPTDTYSEQELVNSYEFQSESRDIPSPETERNCQWIPHRRVYFSIFDVTLWFECLWVWVLLWIVEHSPTIYSYLNEEFSPRTSHLT